MKLYVAGNVRGDGNDALDYATGVRNRLLSFAFIDDWAVDAFEFWITGSPKSQVSIFLDSGAFSALSRGCPIDLDRYCEFVLAHRDRLAAYAVLDVIKDWRATAVNLDLMLARGLDPVPCFHRGSPWSELERLVRAHEYIALGGMVSGNDALTPLTTQPYLDECFRRIRAVRWPVKVHLFGVVAQWILERYPLYSADSASAIVGAGMGRVSRFSGGLLKSRPWIQDVASTWDGSVADGVAAPGSAHKGRRVRNLVAQMSLERYVTDTWARKGVTWD